MIKGNRIKRLKNNKNCHVGRRKLIGLETYEEKLAKEKEQNKLKEMELKKNARKQN